MCRNWEHIFSPFANPARQTNRIHSFLATELEDTGRRDFDHAEDIEHFFLSLPELKEHIHAGEFSQSLHIATVYTALDLFSGRIFK